jgi:hypothetical protein
MAVRHRDPAKRLALNNHALNTAVIDQRSRLHAHLNVNNASARRNDVRNSRDGDQTTSEEMCEHEYSRPY